MDTKHKGKISHTLQAISVIPLLFFGLAIMLFGHRWITQIMHAEVAVELENIMHNTVTLFDTAYPGDYRLVELGNGAYRIYKGEKDITQEYALVDQIKKDTGMDITLFYQDTRILTTIYNSEGDRIVGSGAPSQILDDVFNTGEAHFYNNAIINGATYFAYYAPLLNSDGTVIGMIFAGKPSKSVDNAVQDAVYPLTSLVFITMLVIIICLFFYTRNLAHTLTDIRAFLTQVSTGNTNVILVEKVLKRNDELGDIGRSAVSMQSALRVLIEQDTLTGLFNRRSVERKLKQIISKNSDRHTTFSLAIGDIDFFKKVNDTYGHEAGDLVLKKVSALLGEHMAECGFAARWGGEEFLLCFDQMELTDAHVSLEALLNRIRDLKCEYNGQVIQVTMTFGLIGANTDDINSLLFQADKKLYIGKKNGRNQIVI